MDLSFNVFALVRHIIASGDLTREQVSELESLCGSEDEGDSDNDTPAVKDSSPGEDTDRTNDSDNTSRTDARPPLTSGHRVWLRSNYVGRRLDDYLDSLEEMAVQATIQGKPLGREPWKILMLWFRISQNPFEAPAGRYDDYTWEGALSPDSLLGRSRSPEPSVGRSRVRPGHGTEPLTGKTVNRQGVRGLSSHSCFHPKCGAGTRQPQGNNKTGARRK